MLKIAMRFLDDFKKKPFAHHGPWLAVTLLLVSGVLLIRYALPQKSFSEEVLIYDAIWLEPGRLDLFCR